MDKVCILNFNTGEVFIGDIELKEEDNLIDKFNDKYNLDLDEDSCQWMISQELNINILN